MTLEIAKTFRCHRCGNCCRWPGDVRVDEREIARIAALLGMSPETFIARHTRLTHDRKGLTLLENADGSCRFLHADNSCALQEVKPQQCAGFPTRRAPGYEHLCPGLNDRLREKLSSQGGHDFQQPPVAGPGRD